MGLMWRKSKSMSEDPRKTGLKNGLRQLTLKQLRRVMDYKGEMVLDSYNYVDGKFCPLAVAVKLDQTMTDPSHEKVFEELNKLGYKVYNTRGIVGEFYTKHRQEDLMEVAREVFQEKLAEVIAQGECPCLAVRDQCGPCQDGSHIFCNYYPHGNEEEAYQWFLKNPEIAKSVISRSTDPDNAHARALKTIEEEENGSKN